ncbi:prepilin peptidase [Staphylospora marina]|uniref:prepilin peptidase n=1 Tax=Staphylospora marina TaxID=2490858 RepID=UPI000F5BEDDE|nr:A24 family peptidase [Staphylospora marina]
MVWLEHVLYAGLIVILVAATVTDLKHRLIYDRFVLSGLVLTAGVRLLYRPDPWWNYVLTGVTVFLVLFLIAAWTDETSIGGGDVKLFGMLGLAVGFGPFLLLFLSSHVLAALAVLAFKLVQPGKIDKKTEFPFAPFILAGTVLTYVTVHLI